MMRAVRESAIVRADLFSSRPAFVFENHATDVIE
jgi:hypothetical protein